jgi:hypothetical protein
MWGSAIGLRDLGGTLENLRNLMMMWIALIDSAALGIVILWKEQISTLDAKRLPAAE